METSDKNHMMHLGLRLGALILAAFGVLIFAAYFVLSHNFQNLITDYSLKLVQAMVEQGVTTVEYELRTSQKEAALLAQSFQPPQEGALPKFPPPYFHSDVLRMIYTTPEGCVCSDSGRRNIRQRPDVLTAMTGKTAIYGPYYNDESEYIVCYSAPVTRDGQIIGALSVEKDGYYFCELIKGIRFVDSGESYIINAEGTDIAVSVPEHIEWVTGQYNARRLLREKEDPATRTIVELEQKGLEGKSGAGTYEWEGSLSYLCYKPIPSTGWVLLAGMRRKEIMAMTQSTLRSSLAREPVLIVCIGVFFLLVAAAIFWMIYNLRKSAEINRKLEVLAKYDQLTGLRNRNEYRRTLANLADESHDSLACIYIDANGLHEVNNHLGHRAGDKMLKSVADSLRQRFPKGDIYRIGGDEFVVIYADHPYQETYLKSKRLRDDLRGQGYEISIGIDWRDTDMDILQMINTAEAAMQQDKKQYYKANGKERQLRALDKALEQMMTEKEDAETFLSILAPEYKGVYFVNLDNDNLRHLYIPPYFATILEEVGNLFSKALREYAQRYVEAEYRQQFDKFCDYDYLRALLSGSDSAQFSYRKTDGAWIKLKILKFKTYSEENKETLWIFSV